MEKQGLVIDSDEYGKIVVDIYGTLRTGVDAAKSNGAGAFIKWMPAAQSFFISTFGIPLKHRFTQGQQIRDTMWIKHFTDPAPLSVELQEILKQLTGNNLKPAGELKKYLANPEKYQPPDEWQVPENRNEYHERNEVKEKKLRKKVEKDWDEQLETDLRELGLADEDIARYKKTDKCKTYVAKHREADVKKLVDKLLKLKV